MTDIRAYLRRTGGVDQAQLNKILQELADIQPEVKGEAATQVRIIKGTELVEIDQVVYAQRHNNRLLLETGDFILTESDKYTYIEVNTIRFLLMESDSRLLLETGDLIIIE